MKFWQSLQMTKTEDLVDLAVLLDEQTPFDGAFLGDHWLYPEELLAPYPYTADGKPSWSAESEWPHIAAAMGLLSGATDM